MLKKYVLSLIYLQVCLLNLSAQNVLITEVSGNEYGYGIYNIRVDLNEFSLATGIYYTRLIINGQRQTMKTIVLR